MCHIFKYLQYLHFNNKNTNKPWCCLLIMEPAVFKGNISDLYVLYGLVFPKIQCYTPLDYSFCAFFVESIWFLDSFCLGSINNYFLYTVANTMLHIRKVPRKNTGFIYAFMLYMLAVAWCGVRGYVYALGWNESQRLEGSN